jgi:hypothetical protein
MRNDGVTKEIGNNSMEIAVEAFGKSIARWTEQGEQHVTAVPGLSLFRRTSVTRHHKFASNSCW